MVHAFLSGLRCNIKYPFDDKFVVHLLKVPYYFNEHKPLNKFGALECICYLDLGYTMSVIDDQRLYIIIDT